MLAEQFKKKRFEEGEAAQQKKWEEWNERRMEAEARGEAFNEAPPTLEKRK